MNQNSPEYTDQLAGFVSELTWEGLPAEVVDKLKTHVLDTLGVSLRASLSPQSQQTVTVMRTMGGSPDCTVLGHDFKTNMLDAAYLNSAMGHVLDFDDGHKFAHIGAAIVPTCLAVSERENVTGKDLILGLACGYEVTARVSIAAGVPHRKRGFATTGTANYFGASAAASKLLGLDQEKTVLAMGIAGNEASGLSQHQFGGGHTKHLNSAAASRSGVLGALLSQEGFRGNTHILEGELGFLNVQCDGGSPDDLIDGLGTNYALMWTNLKPYPSCRQGHCAVDLAMKAVHEHSVDYQDVESVTVHTFPFAMQSWFSTNAAPVNEVEAALRTPFAVATTLIYKNVTLESFTPERVKDPKILEMLKNITVVEEESFAENWPDKRRVKLNIKFKNGETLELETDNPRGSTDYPLSFDDVAEKYSNVVEPVLAKDRIASVIERVGNLEQENDVPGLMSLLAKEPALSLAGE